MDIGHDEEGNRNRPAKSLILIYKLSIILYLYYPNSFSILFFYDSSYFWKTIFLCNSPLMLENQRALNLLSYVRLVDRYVM
jgi:hypothetical protein